MIGVLVNPGNPNAASDRARRRLRPRRCGSEVHAVDIVAERDLDAAFDDLHRAQAAAVLVFPDALFTAARDGWPNSLPATSCRFFFLTATYVEAGGLMSYGSSRSDAYREAGIYVGRILGTRNLPTYQ